MTSGLEFQSGISVTRMMPAYTDHSNDRVTSDDLKQKIDMEIYAKKKPPERNLR